MALSLTNSGILQRSRCSGLKVEQYANAHVSNGFKPPKAMKVIGLQTPQTKDVKIKSQQMELASFQPCLVRRGVLVGIGASFLTIFSTPTESAEAQTGKADWKTKLLEKFEELLEKMGLKKNNKDEMSLKTPKQPSEKAQRVDSESLVVEVDFSH